MEVQEKLVFLNAVYLYYGSNYHDVDKVVNDMNTNEP